MKPTLRRIPQFITRNSMKKRLLPRLLATFAVVVLALAALRPAQAAANDVSGGVLMSITTQLDADGNTYRDEDIFAVDLATETTEMVFDGSDLGLEPVNVAAFAQLNDDSLLIAFNQKFKLDGYGRVMPNDIMRFVPTSLGDDTAGSWELYFDGSDVGLTTGNEQIDAIAFEGNGRLLISTERNYSVPGLPKGGPGDLIAFTAASLGANTAGSWELFFDGDDIGIDNAAEENMDSAAFDAATGALYFSTSGHTILTDGTVIRYGDVVACVVSSFGSDTACSSIELTSGSDYVHPHIDIDGLWLATADSDGDGVPDDADNCVDTPNPGQEDSYGSEAGDACEDSDGDGTPDAAEANFCVSIDGVLLVSQGTASCESTATEGAASNVAIANGNFATAIASRDMIVFGARVSSNLYARAIGDGALAWARAGENLTAIAEGSSAFAVSHSGANSSAKAMGDIADAQVFFGDNNHATATGDQVAASAGNGNNNTANASGAAGSNATAAYGNNNTAESSGGERAQAWFGSDMSATSTFAYTCTNENGEVAVDEDKCS